MKKAFAYLRASGKGQVTVDGFPSQEKAIRQYASANGIKILNVFKERCLSGAEDLGNRPALMELITALHSNGTRLVIVEKLGRLACDLMIQETIVADLRKNGFELISVLEPDLMKDDPSRKMMRQIFGAVAEYEKAMIVLKLRGARMKMKAVTGRCEGAKPYGTLSGEPGTIARMRALQASGLGFDRIAAALNAEGIKPRRGARWWGQTINNILANRRGENR